ncbi:MAG: penicillin acylase family protein [Verrucomicrobia bacterium]|nr:penicillin acylase family protein [Verrucomicrobiota bacterium]
MRILRRLLAALVLLLVLVFLGLRWTLRGSLAQLDGQAMLPGLTAPVQIERDAQGVPTIRAQNELDLSRTLGFVHAQDRFFQMDLLRRNAAGELAELFGPAALPRDRANRLHRFRARAAAILGSTLESVERDLVRAYTEGVNAGLAALRVRPWEYLLLRTAPRPWTAEDTLLVGYAMHFDLHGDLTKVRSKELVRTTFGADLAEFLDPNFTPDDAALDDSTQPLRPIPGPQVVDLRTLSNATAALGPLEPPDLPGSNNFAVSGKRTAHGGGMVAGDMHLSLGLPCIWYRASLALPDRTLTGVTLPGVNVLIAGSNGRIAWAFTNSHTLTSREVPLEIDPASAQRYRGADGNFVAMREANEQILVQGAPTETLRVQETEFGPVVGTRGGRTFARDWLAHRPAQMNLALLQLGAAASVAEALPIAHRAGVPPQNLLVVDAAGDAAWTIIGRTDISPPVIRRDSLWTGNNRVVGGDGFVALGDGGQAMPYRAAQIRDALQALPNPVRPADLLGVALDDRALFLERWHQLMLATLTPAACAEKPARAELRKFVEQWGGRASVDSVGYLAVRTFRAGVDRRLLQSIHARLKMADNEYDPRQLRVETALWSVLQARPEHWLPKNFPTWDSLLLAAADDFLSDAVTAGVPLREMTWGRRNVVRIRHPIARALPDFFGRWLNAPAQPLPGDGWMPRVQTPTFGASQRMVVAPGREAEGIFHLPGGSSGHPLSPYYLAGYADWARGKATPFLPGPPQHRLELR